MKPRDARFGSAVLAASVIVILSATSAPVRAGDPDVDVEGSGLPPVVTVDPELGDGVEFGMGVEPEGVRALIERLCAGQPLEECDPNIGREGAAAPPIPDQKADQSLVHDALCDGIVSASRPLAGLADGPFDAQIAQLVEMRREREQDVRIREAFEKFFVGIGAAQGILAGPVAFIPEIGPFASALYGASAASAGLHAYEVSEDIEDIEREIEQINDAIDRLRQANEEGARRNADDDDVTDGTGSSSDDQPPPPDNNPEDGDTQPVRGDHGGGGDPAVICGGNDTVWAGDPAIEDAQSPVENSCDDPSVNPADKASTEDDGSGQPEAARPALCHDEDEAASDESAIEAPLVDDTCADTGAGRICDDRPGTGGSPSGSAGWVGDVADALVVPPCDPKVCSPVP